MLTKIVTLSHRIGVRPWRSSSQPGLSSRSLKQSEDFGWSQSRIFCPTPTQEVRLDRFLHHTPKLGIFFEMVQFLMKLWLKQIILFVYHDFHGVPVASQFLTVKFHLLYVKESESEILSPTTQPCSQPTLFINY